MVLAVVWMMFGFGYVISSVWIHNSVRTSYWKEDAPLKFTVIFPIIIASCCGILGNILYYYPIRFLWDR